MQNNFVNNEIDALDQITMHSHGLIVFPIFIFLHEGITGLTSSQVTHKSNGCFSSKSFTQALIITMLYKIHECWCGYEGENIRFTNIGLEQCSSVDCRQR